MFFDIGSNDGSWTLANVNQCNKIITVEASPITFRRLVQNIRNSYIRNRSLKEKVTLINYAVCNNNGKDITFYHAKTDVLSTLNKEWLTSKESRFYNQPYTEIKCKTITIDKMIEAFGMPQLIKIDVEGGEYDCITSLTQKVPLLCFEWASEIQEIAVKCIDYLFTLGYTQFYIQKEDAYTFRPNDADYYDIETVKMNLLKTIPKDDWGMIWCK